MEQLENKLINNYNSMKIKNSREIWDKNRYTIDKCIQELTDLLGANVTIFGQKTKLNSEIPEFCIDTREWLEYVKNNEFDLMDIAQENHLDLDTEYSKIDNSYYNSKGFWESLKDNQLDSNNILMQILVQNGIFEELEKDTGNTYNWNSTVYNNISWRGYRKVGDDENFYYLIYVHEFGDTRTNYTEDIVLCFDYAEGLIESMAETRLYKRLVLNGIAFDMDTDICCETFNCYNEFGEDLWYNILGYDKETITESIESKIQEQVDKLEIGKHIEINAISNKELFEKLNNENKMYGYVNYEIKDIDNNKQVFYVDIDGIKTEIKFTDIFRVID